MAFLVLLESLTPVERALFLLREVFDYEYAEIASLVALLTTYKRDVRRSAPLSTSRWGDLAYFRTWDTAWKLRRIRNNPRVQFAPPRPVANRRRHRYGPAPGCWKVKIRPCRKTARQQVSCPARPPCPTGP